MIKILKKMESHQEFVSGKPQTEEQILNLEKELGMKFPVQYKFFLTQYGYMAWFGGEIYGPSDDDYCDLITRNRKAREMIFPEEFNLLPTDAFVFTEYPGGGYYMLFGENSERAGEVGLFLHETCNQEVQQWSNFKDFLEDYFG